MLEEEMDVDAATLSQPVEDENIYGENSHHKIESCFKALARSLKGALEIDKRVKKVLPSTKGKL